MNGVPLVVLVIIFISMRFHRDFKTASSRLFRLLMYLNAVLLIGEMLLVWASSGQTSFYRGANIAINVITFITLPALVFVWLIYTLKEIGIRFSFKKWWALPLAMPLLVSIAMTIGSIFNELYFFIDAANVYERGHLFWLHAAISFFTWASVWCSRFPIEANCHAMPLYRCCCSRCLRRSEGRSKRLSMAF